jgi:AbrB family looped-hinge helix DNA binding protein
MTITIDKAGRVIIPKKLRDDNGMNAGTKLEIESARTGELRIRIPQPESSFIESDGVLIHHGNSVAHHIDIAHFINQQRDQKAKSNTPSQP